MPLFIFVSLNGHLLCARAAARNPHIRERTKGDSMRGKFLWFRENWRWRDNVVGSQVSIDFFCVHIASSTKALRHNGGGGGGRKFKVNAAIRTSLRHILSLKLVRQRRFGAKFTCDPAKSHRPHVHGMRLSRQIVWTRKKYQVLCEWVIFCLLDVPLLFVHQ